MQQDIWGDIFTQIPKEKFLEEYSGEQFLRSSSPCDFSKILSWKDINDVLTYSNLKSPQVRVSLNNEIIPESQYTIKESRRREATNYISPTLLSGFLKKGGVLVIDSIQEYIPSINRVAGEFSSIFNEKVQVNCYIGGLNSSGFDIHWDDHDVVILQIFGEKEWEIRPPTRKYPLYDDLDQNLKPPQSVTWSGTFKQGQSMYIPRGWWHKAFTTSSYSCHLTFGIPQRTWIDYFKYILDLCKEDEQFRSNVLNGKTANLDAESFLEILKNKTKEYTNESFRKHYGSLFSPRVRHSLPYGLFGVQREFDVNSKIALSFFHRPEIFQTGESVFFSVFEKKYTFAKSTFHFFSTLWNSSEPINIERLVSLSKPALDEDHVKELITLLLEKGIVELYT